MYKIYCDNELIHDGSSPDKSVHLLAPKVQLIDNAAGSATFTVPVENVGYGQIGLFTSTIVIEKDGEKIWVGRPITADINFYNQISFTCEGALAFLNDTLQEPLTINYSDPGLFIKHCLDVHNAKVDATRRIYYGTIDVTDSDTSYVYSTEYVSTWEAIKTNCLDRLQGHMRIRYRNSDLRMFLDYVSDYASTSAQKIDFGNNLVDFARNWNVSDMVTAVIPLGAQLEEVSDEESDTSSSAETTEVDTRKEYLTVASVNQGSIYVYNTIPLQLYGRVEQVISFSDVDDATLLLALANLYLSSLQYMALKLEIKAIDMHYLTNSEESFNILDRVRCISAPHGLDAYFPIYQIDISIDNPANDIYYLGRNDGQTSTMTGQSGVSQSATTQAIADAEKSAIIKTETLLADYAHITNGIIDNASIDQADVNNLEANYAHIVDGVIDNAKIDYADVNDLEANFAHVSNGLIDNAYISYARVQDLITNFAHITNGIIDNASIDQADVNNLEANYAHIVDGVIDNAQINYANVVDLATHFAHIHNGVIDNATIGYANVNDLAAHYALIDVSNVSNSWINRGVIRDAAISDAMISDVSANKLTAGEINAGQIRVYNLDAANITVGTLNGQRIGEGTVSLDKLSEDVYTADEIEAIVAVLNDRIDGAIETFTGTAVPTLVNTPASDWTTDALKDQHVGDVYYVVNSSSEYDGYSYRFSKINGVYSWQLIQDTAITAALQRLTTAENNIVAIQQFDSDIYLWRLDTDSTLGNLIASHNDLVVNTNKALVSTTQVWLNTSSTVPPSKPEQPVLNGSYLTDSNDINVLDSDGESIPTQEWYITIPEYDESKPYYYYCYEYQYMDGTYGWSDPVYDRGISEAYQDNNSGVEAVIQLWVTRSNQTLPAKPTDTSHTGAGVYYEFLTDSNGEYVLDSDGERIATQSAWNIFVPAYNEAFPYYFYCYEYQFLDGSYGWSDPVLDKAMTEVQSKTENVLTELETKVSSNTFNEVVQQVDQNSATITTISETTETALQQSVEYIVGSQASSTGSWLGTTRDDTIRVGKTIAYKLPYAGSGDATLQLTLNDGTVSEAIPVYINDSRVSTQFEANSVVTLTYDGSKWRATGYWTDDTYNRMRYQSAITANTAITSGRLICGTDTGYKNISSGASFNLAHPLLYARDSISTGSTGDNNDLMASDILYSSNGTIQNGSSGKVLYLKGTVAGNTFTVATSNYLTTIIPTVEDGFYYIPLGVMSSATRGSFSSTNQLMAYYNGAFQQANLSTVTTSNTVNEVKQTANSNSAKITNLTTRLGTNADGTASQNDIVNKYSSLEQDLDSFKTTVGSTYYTKTEAERVTERVTQAESSIAQNSEAIILKADSSSVYTKQQTDTLITNEATNRNSAISVATDGIMTNVSNTYITRTEFNNTYTDGRNLLKFTKAFSGIDIIDSNENPIIDSNGQTIGKYYNGSLHYSAATRLSEPNSDDFYIRELDNTTMITNDYSEFAFYKDVIAPSVGLTYYFSFYAKGTGSITAYFYPNSEGESLSATTSQGTSSSSSDGKIAITLSNEWTRYWVKWVLGGIASGNRRNVLLRLYGGNSASVYGLKFEQNNRETDWTAAPEDIDLYTLGIVGLAERIDRAESSITQTENNINFRIDETITINRNYVDEIVSVEAAHRTSEINQTSSDILIRVSEDYASKDDLENLEIGGRNYLLNTREFLGSGIIDSNNQEILDSDGNIIGSSLDRYVGGGSSSIISETYRDLNVRYLDNTSQPNTTYKDFVQFSNILNPKVGEFYTLGFYAKGTGSIQAQFYGLTQSAIFNADTCQGNELYDLYDGSISVQLTSSWEKYWIRWLCTSVISTEMRNLRLRLYGGNAAYICGMKLELGSKSTDWTAAPEDNNSVTKEYVRMIGDAIVTSTEASIQVTSDNIMSVVSAKTDKGDIISTINQSPERITIDASRISLIGNTDFTNLDNYTKKLEETVNQIDDTVINMDGDLTDLKDSVNNISSSKADKNSTVADTQYIYISVTSGTNSVAAPEEWISNNTGEQNIWTTSRPEYNSNYPVLFIAKQTIYANGILICTVPAKDLTTTVIDGGHITTGKIDAARIAVNQISVGDLADGSSYATISKSVTETQIIYISKVSNVTSLDPYKTWVTRSDDVQNTWTLKRPSYDSSYPNIFFAEQIKYVKGNIKCSSPVLDTISNDYARRNESVTETQIIYISKKSTVNTVNAPSSWVTRSENVQNKWTLIRPSYNASYPNVFYCLQKKYTNNDIKSETPVKDTIGDSYSSKGETLTNYHVIYISSSESSASSIIAPTEWVTNSSDVQNTWTSVRPSYNASYPYIYYAIQRLYGNNDITLSDIAQDSVSNTYSPKAVTVSQTQIVYISRGSKYKNYSELTVPSTYWITDSTGEQDKWTTVRPEYDRDYPYLFSGRQIQYVSGSISVINAKRDRTTTIIDGASIITGSIDAEKIDTNTLTVASLYDADDYSKKNQTITETQYIYYKSYSNTSPNLPSDWIDTVNDAYNKWTTYPLSFESGYYLYQAYQYKYANDNTYTVWMNLNKIESAIRSNAGISETQVIYCNAYSNTSISTMKQYLPSGWITENTSTPNYETYPRTYWTTSRPQYNSDYPVTFMATQFKQPDGNVITSDPSKDDSMTVIDGGHITTGSIDAGLITTGTLDCEDLEVINLSASDITTGTLDGIEIKAKKGEIAGFTIDADKLYYNRTRLTGAESGVYIGTNGISTGDGTRFVYTSMGQLRGGLNSTIHGYLAFNTRDTNNNAGVMLAGRRFLCLSSPNLYVANSYNENETFSGLNAKKGLTHTINGIIRNASINTDGTIGSYGYVDYEFTNGILTRYTLYN